MSQEIMPCVYYPTTLTYVDDDEKALKGMEGLLGREYALQLFKDPKAALDFFKEQYKFEPFTQRCIVEAEDIIPEHRIINFNIRAIRDQALNPDRFKEIGTIIIDYAMPKLNGGQLAEQLSSLPFKIILLTGEADAQTAVKLFNDGVIHSYIRKDDLHFKTLIFQIIKNLTRQYFQQSSKVILDNFPSHYWMKDPLFKEMFTKLCEDNNLNEYYLLDEFGSYQFLDNQGNLSFLSVADDDLMKAYLLYAEGDNAPKAIVEGIRSKISMPFFYSEEDFNVRPAEWGPFMHPTQVLKAQENYYYSYIPNPDPKIYKQEGKIFSYDEFLRAQG